MFLSRYSCKLLPCMALSCFLGTSSAFAGPVLFLVSKGGLSDLVVVDAKLNGQPVNPFSGTQAGSLHDRYWFDGYSLSLSRNNADPAPNLGPLPGSSLDSRLVNTGFHGADPENVDGKIMAAAIQLAVLTVEYGGGLRQSAGSLNDGTQEKAAAHHVNLYLSDASLVSNGPVSSPADFEADPHPWDSHGSGGGPQGPLGLAPVPEPSTLISASCAGALTVSYAGWRRRRKGPAA